MPEQVDELTAQLHITRDVDEETREGANHEECAVNVAPPFVPAYKRSITTR